MLYYPEGDIHRKITYPRLKNPVYTSLHPTPIGWFAGRLQVVLDGVPGFAGRVIGASFPRALKLKPRPVYYRELWARLADYRL